MTFKWFANLGLLLATIVVGACGYEAVDGSGARINAGGSRHFVDIGDYRIASSEVVAARKYTIPETRSYGFSWSPEAYARRKRAQGLRSPTEADWRRLVAILEAGNSDIDWGRFVAEKRAQQDGAQYKGYVGQDGRIEFCSGTISGRSICPEGLSLDRSARLRLARQVPRQTDPGCRFGRVDPPEILALAPHRIESGERQLVVEILCDR